MSKKPLSLTIVPMAVIIVSVFVIGIAGANLLGVWKTTNTKEPVKIKTGEFAGLPNPADIRGSYTWADVGKAFNIDVQHLLTAFGATDPAVKVNTLEAIYPKESLPAGLEIGTGSVRLFVSLYTGILFTADEGTVLPISAITVLKEFGKADPSLIADAESKAYNPAAKQSAAAKAPATTATTAPAPASQPAAAAKPAETATTAPAKPATTATTVKAVPAAETPAPAASAKTTSTTVAGTAETHEVKTGTVTGKTTFKDLKDWGLTEEKIKSATGGKIGPDSAVIKDWAEPNGLTFAELKTKLQALLDTK